MANKRKSKITAGVLAIFLGSIGAHKFYLDFPSTGLIMLLISIIGGYMTDGLASTVVGIIALIEGIIYLTKSNEDFFSIYEYGRRKWF